MFFNSIKEINRLRKEINRLITLSVPEKLKNSIFEKSTIAQTLNINNLRTTSAKSINLHATIKLIEHSLKNLP